MIRVCTFFVDKTFVNTKNNKTIEKVQTEYSSSYSLSSLLNSFTYNLLQE